MSATSGTQCPGLATGVNSTDAFGDGCLAVNGIFGTGGRGGVQVDSFGNVIVADDVNSIIHLINPSTGIMTKLAGLGTTCSGKLDSAGDGCLAATQSLAAGERGIGLDPYGNVFLPGYSDHLVRMICRTASPLCTSAQIGYMEAVAGCSTGTGVTGTTGLGLDNTLGLKLNAGTCTTSLGEVETPRGVTADMYGNVYYAGTASYRFRVVVGPLTSTYFRGNNPIYAALGVHYPSVTQGYVYNPASPTPSPALWVRIRRPAL